MNRVSYVVDNKFTILEVKKTINKINGLPKDCDTLLSVIEKSIACDFSGYYDDRDKKVGVEYNKGIEKSSLEFKFGTLSYVNNKTFIRLPNNKVHCIRYAGGDRIRSFWSPTEESTKPNQVGVSLTQYSSILSVGSWNRLIKLFNEMVGFQAVELSKDLALRFHFGEDNKWSTDTLKAMYVLLSECFLTQAGQHRILLLSKLDYLDAEKFSKLLTALNRVSNLDSILFTNDYSVEALGKGVDVGHLNV